jgi:hypothetical protein
MLEVRWWVLGAGLFGFRAGCTDARVCSWFVHSEQPLAHPPTRHHPAPCTRHHTPATAA